MNEGFYFARREEAFNCCQDEHVVNEIVSDHCTHDGHAHLSMNKMKLRTAGNY